MVPHNSVSYLGGGGLQTCDQRAQRFCLAISISLMLPAMGRVVLTSPWALPLSTVSCLPPSISLLSALLLKASWSLSPQVCPLEAVPCVSAPLYPWYPLYFLAACLPSSQL